MSSNTTLLHERGVTTINYDHHSRPTLPIHHFIVRCFEIIILVFLHSCEPFLVQTNGGGQEALGLAFVVLVLPPAHGQAPHRQRRHGRRLDKGWRLWLATSVTPVGTTGVNVQRRQLARLKKMCGKGRVTRVVTPTSELKGVRYWA